MPTTSTVMGFDIRSSADPFSHTALWTQNFGQILDANPGTFLCLSTSRPSTWGANQNGRRIYELDTGLTWNWTGTQFVRSAGKGLLQRSPRTSPISTSASAMATVVSATAVPIPAGNRSIFILCAIPQINATAGATKLAIFRDTTQLQLVEAQATSGSLAAGTPGSKFMFAYDVPGLANTTYSLQFATDPTFGGTCTLGAGTNQPITLNVIEL